jgi:serine/threonine protein kinase
MTVCALDRIEYNAHKPEIQRFSQKYFLHNTFNSGQFNAVASGYNRTTYKKVVIKAIYKPEGSTIKEPLILQKLLNVNGVIKYLDHYAINCDTHLIVTEYFGHMNLQKFLSTNGPVSETLAHTIFKQLFTTAHQCFQLNILHRKLKPSNIIINVNTNKIKITNFNSASQFEMGQVFSSQLNNKIAPPEYFETRRYTADSLYAWYLGLILYELLFNEKPFKSTDDILNTSLEPLFIPHHNRKNLSLDVIVFLNWLLAKSDRITLNQIAHHPWITKQWT